MTVVRGGPPECSSRRAARLQRRAARLTRGTGEDQAAARERREAYVRGHQLAEMRTTAGVTQAELAEALGVSQARISKIQHGEISGIDVVRAYVAATRWPTSRPMHPSRPRA
jgi:ribosome-binding protein aMBF1 (putative translation factor)